MASHRSPIAPLSLENRPDTKLAWQECRRWIEAVTGERFSADNPLLALQDGILLCELLNAIRPGTIRRINRRAGAFAHMENINFFLDGCRYIGLSSAALFSPSQLQAQSREQLRRRPSQLEALKRADQQNLKSVAITLYWLGHKVQSLHDYNGPQLQLSAFHNLVGKDSLPESVQGPTSPSAWGAADEWLRAEKDRSLKRKQNLEAALKQTSQPPSTTTGTAFNFTNTAATGKRNSFGQNSGNGLGEVELSWLHSKHQEPSTLNGFQQQNELKVTAKKIDKHNTEESNGIRQPPPPPPRQSSQEHIRHSLIKDLSNRSSPVAVSPENKQSAQCAQLSTSNSDEELEASIMEELEREQEVTRSRQAELQRRLLAEQDKQRRQEFARLSQHLSDEEADAALVKLQQSTAPAAASQRVASSKSVQTRHEPLRRKAAVGESQTKSWREPEKSEGIIQSGQAEGKRRGKVSELMKIQESAARVREMWRLQDAAQRQMQKTQANMVPLSRRATVGGIATGFDSKILRQRPLSAGEVSISPDNSHRSLPVDTSQAPPATSSTFHSQISPSSEPSPPSQKSSGSSQSQSVSSTFVRRLQKRASLPNLSPLSRRYSHERIMKEHEQRQAELKRLKEERHRSELAFLETEREIQNEMEALQSILKQPQATQVVAKVVAKEMKQYLPQETKPADSLSMTEMENFAPESNVEKEGVCEVVKQQLVELPNSLAQSRRLSQDEQQRDQATRHSELSKQVEMLMGTQADSDSSSTPEGSVSEAFLTSATQQARAEERQQLQKMQSGDAMDGGSIRSSRKSSAASLSGSLLGADPDRIKKAQQYPSVGLSEQKVWRTFQAEHDLFTQLAGTLKGDGEALPATEPTLARTVKDHSNEMERLLQLADEQAREQQELLEEHTRLAAEEERRIHQQEKERNQRRRREEENRRQQEETEARWRAIEEERIRQMLAEQVEEDLQRKHLILVAKASLEASEDERTSSTKHTSEEDETDIGYEEDDEPIWDIPTLPGMERSQGSFHQAGSKKSPPQWLLDELEQHKQEDTHSDQKHQPQPYFTLPMAATNHSSLPVTTANHFDQSHPPKPMSKLPISAQIGQDDSLQPYATFQVSAHSDQEKHTQPYATLPMSSQHDLPSPPQPYSTLPMPGFAASQVRGSSQFQKSHPRVRDGSPRVRECPPQVRSSPPQTRTSPLQARAHSRQVPSQRHGDIPPARFTPPLSQSTPMPPRRPSPPSRHITLSHTQSSPAQSRSSRSYTDDSPPPRPSPPRESPQSPHLSRTSSLNSGKRSSGHLSDNGDDSRILCVVCSRQLTPTSAMMYASKPHCQFCYSTNEGLLTTEV